MRPFLYLTAVAAAFVLIYVSLPLFDTTGSENRRGGVSGDDADKTRLSRLLGAGEDVEKLRALHATFLAEGEPGWAETSVARILYFEPRDEWANRQAGRFDLRPEYAAIPPAPDLALYPNEAMERLTAYEKAGIYWADAGDLAHVRELREQAVAHAVRLRGDPVYRDEWVWRTWMSRHPIFKDVPTVVGYRPPYLVFVQADRGTEERAGAILDRVAGLLTFLYADFRRLFAERFDLPELPGEARGELRVAKTFVFANERTYEAYQTLIGDPVAGDVQAHYRLDDQWIVLYEGEGAEKRAAAGEADVNTQKVLFTGVQQLLHLYRRILVERESGEFVGWKDPRLISDLPWFETGFARFLATARTREDGAFELMATNRMNLEELAKVDALPAGRPLLQDMLDLTRAQLAAGDGFSLRDSTERWRFFLRAWSFCHFLWYGDDGRYRDRLVDYLGRELHGESGPAVFSDAFWREETPDWPGIETRWRAHVEALLRSEGIR